MTDVFLIAGFCCFVACWFLSFYAVAEIKSNDPELYEALGQPARLLWLNVTYGSFFFWIWSRRYKKVSDNKAILTACNIVRTFQLLMFACFGVALLTLALR
jgi:hypothetical protein